MYCIFDNKRQKNTKKVLYFDIKCKNTKKHKNPINVQKNNYDLCYCFLFLLVV